MSRPNPMPRRDASNHSLSPRALSQGRSARNAATRAMAGELLIPVPPRPNLAARALPAPSLLLADALILGLAFALIRLV